MKEFVEKLIKALNHQAYYSCSHCMDDAIEVVKKVAEEYNGGWIPVSDKLPDKDMWCLATFESGGIDKIQYLVTNKWGWNGEFADNKVVAWMPLPEPFNTKGE